MTLPRDLRYPLGLDIEAGTRHAAIMAAGERLRTGVSVTKLRRARSLLRPPLHRNAGGPVRTERCVCGGTITAPSLEDAAPYVEGHNASPEHFAWRLQHGPSRERPTAAEPDFRDDGLCPQSGPGRSRASAAAVRGRLS